MVQLQEETRKRKDSPKSDETIVDIENVNAWYKDKQALIDVNMRIRKNNITAFIGPSGCGKTTLLRCLNRMNDIIPIFRMTGTINVDGENIYDEKKDVISIRRKIGMVFQQPNPFPMSIYNNLKMPIKENMGRINGKLIKEMILKSLEDSHLSEEIKGRLQQSAMKLSGGQQQRLCIARALVIRPEIILFDEPCSALDPISTMKIEDLLEDLKKEFTIIIVTHNLEQARRIGDYVAFFYQGKIVEQGTSNDIFTNPKCELTQNYLTGIF